VCEQSVPWKRTPSHFVRAFARMRKGVRARAIMRTITTEKIPSHNSVCTNQNQTLNAAIHEFTALVEFNPNLWPGICNIRVAEDPRQVTDINSTDALEQWHSTFFVRVPPDIISLQLCTPKVVGV
jgi:hypothetical protein